VAAAEGVRLVQQLIAQFEKDGFFEVKGAGVSGVTDSDGVLSRGRLSQKSARCEFDYVKAR